MNEFKIGYNGPPTRINGVAPTVNGVDFGNLAFNLSGSIANTGIAGQSSSSGIVVPGGLVRANSATNGRGQPYDPWSLAFADTVSRITGNHLTKIGVDVRMIRMTTDQLGGTTYTYPNITAFLANQPSAIQYLGDISAPSVFNNGATGMRHTEQQYFVAFAQDEWHATQNLTLNYGLALRLLHADEGARQPDRQVQHRDRPDRSEHDAAPRREEEQLPAAGVDDLCARQDGLPRRLRRVRRPRSG